MGDAEDDQPINLLNTLADKHIIQDSGHSHLLVLRRFLLLFLLGDEGSVLQAFRQHTASFYLISLKWCFLAVRGLAS